MRTLAVVRHQDLMTYQIVWFAQLLQAQNSQVDSNLKQFLENSDFPVYESFHSMAEWVFFEYGAT
jgi:hypothetical protein